MLAHLQTRIGLPSLSQSIAMKVPLNFVHVFLLQVSMSCFAMEVTNIATDQAALLALKVNVNDTGEILANNWTETAPVCSWIGVSCGAQHHRIVALNLSYMGLDGRIPSQIGSLPFLASLSIRKNSFYGPLPNELGGLHRLKILDMGFNFLSGDIPPFLGSMPKLQILLLEANNFVGSVPSLSNSSSLQKFNASNNRLSGSMPSDILNSSSLQVLDLSFNELSSTLSMDFCDHLPKLQGLYISRNRFYGSMPRSIRNCTFLRDIDFSQNNLNGSIPSEIGELSNLETFRIHDNALTGSIPSVLFNISTMKAIATYANHLSGSLPITEGLFLPNLIELLLHGNDLHGTIPSYICNASKLTFLDLSDNSFTGFVPATLGSLRYLQKLYLANNHLSIESSTPGSSFFSSLTNCKYLRKIGLSGNPLNATLPISVGNLSASLEQFLAQNCNINGSIPEEIGNLTNLIALSLGNNQLTGIIPTTIGRLKKLQGLHLQGNKLQGKVVSDLCYLHSLSYLFLGRNNLSGSIPECLGNLTSLRNLSLSSNSLTSRIPSSLWSLYDILAINMSSNFLSGSIPRLEGMEVLVELDLSENEIFGEIPMGLGFTAPALVYLALAKNRLTGQIPESLADLKSLEFLDLSRNKLSGVIPTKLENLSYLKYFNVSYNGLEGEIPSRGPFARFSAQSYMMNAELCGAPTLRVPPCVAPTLRVPPSVGTAATEKRTLLSLIPVLLILGCILRFMFILILAIILLLRQSKQKMPCITALRWPKGRTPSCVSNRRFSNQELEQATDGFSKGNLLGMGRFGSVYRGILPDGKVVAIKVFNVKEERSLRSFEVEAEIMHSVRHRNLVRILCSCNRINLKALVMEYMSNGSLEKWLHTHNYHLDILQRLDIMIDTAAAVEYLHNDYLKPIVHCDLKPGNILLDEDMIAHVSDFGIAKLIDPDLSDPTRQSTVVCTFGYPAPEYGLYGIVSTQSDVYSFGILLMETFTGKKPTDEMFGGDMTLRHWVMGSMPRELRKVIDPSLLQAEEEQFDAKIECVSLVMRLAQCCSAETPSERLSMREVLYRLSRIKEIFVESISGD